MKTVWSHFFNYISILKKFIRFSIENWTVSLSKNTSPSWNDILENRAIPWLTKLGDEPTWPMMEETARSVGRMGVCLPALHLFHCSKLPHLQTIKGGLHYNLINLSCKIIFLFLTITLVYIAKISFLQSCFQNDETNVTYNFLALIFTHISPYNCGIHNVLNDERKKNCVQENMKSNLLGLRMHQILACCNKHDKP